MINHSTYIPQSGWDWEIPGKQVYACTKHRIENDSEIREHNFGTYQLKDTIVHLATDRMLCLDSVQGCAEAFKLFVCISELFIYRSKRERELKV